MLRIEVGALNNYGAEALIDKKLNESEVGSRDSDQSEGSWAEEASQSSMNAEA